MLDVSVLVWAHFYAQSWAQSWHAKAFTLCSVLNGITQSYLPHTRFTPASAEQYREHYISYELLYVAAHFIDLERMEA